MYLYEAGLYPVRLLVCLRQYFPPTEVSGKRLSHHVEPGTSNVQTACCTTALQSFPDFTVLFLKKQLGLIAVQVVVFVSLRLEGGEIWIFFFPSGTKSPRLTDF